MAVDEKNLRIYEYYKSYLTELFKKGLHLKEAGKSALFGEDNKKKYTDLRRKWKNNKELSKTGKLLKVDRDSFGSNKMCQFFVKTYCLWHKQLENEILLGGHRAPFFRNGPNVAIFDLLKYGVNGKTVTCLPLGSSFDNF